MNRRKELIEEYKQMKPDMGIFMIRSEQSNKCFLETSQDLKGKINGEKFKLGAGMHPCRELQREWTEHGEEGFKIEVLEKLPYSKDESKTGYTEELEILRLMWEERLAAENFEFYERRKKS